MKKTFLLLLACLALNSLYAQEDADGCKDHPMFNRMPDFKIIQCTQNYAALEVVTGNEKKETQEGTLTHLDYGFNAESQHKNPSWLQIMKNYENAMMKLGGKKIFSNSEHATFKINKEGKDIWLMLTMNSGEDLRVEEWFMDILEKEEMKQDITANNIYSALNKNGSVALYINFETGKADIKSESQTIVGEIAAMMKSNPALMLNIEGHTDNVGTATANKTLSDLRAKAVMKAVTAQGIQASRLSAKGWGQEKPVADNATEEGKAKNRRVEIVKM